MSSFRNPHYIYLFDMKNGKKKLAYGRDPADALDILGFRLTSEELAEILPDRFVKIRQTELHRFIERLG
jgi:hypothetical protein